MRMEYIKDFDGWNKEKKRLQKITNRIEPNVWEIWMYKVWINLGNEISKEKPFMRPCVILNNFIGWDLILIAPLTSKKHNGKFEIEITEYEIYGLARLSYVLINQVKPISKKRLIYNISTYRVWREKIKLVSKSVLEIIKRTYTSKMLKI